MTSETYRRDAERCSAKVMQQSLSEYVTNFELFEAKQCEDAEKTARFFACRNDIAVDFERCIYSDATAKIAAIVLACITLVLSVAVIVVVKRSTSARYMPAAMK